MLAGDNALIIATSVQSLPLHQRKMGIALGAAGAVVLRILMTMAAAPLLKFQFIKLIGGAFVIWIGVKVFADTRPSTEPARGDLWKAVGSIVVADIAMSMDNILAVAGASKGDMRLIIFGLGVSIPFVVFASHLIAGLMSRHAWIITLGAAILGKVGAEMMLTDPWIAKALHPSAAMIYAGEALAIAGILVAGKIVRASTPTRP